MSYDLHLLRPGSGDETAVEIETLLDAESDVPNSGPPDPEKEARKRHLAQILRRSNPALSIFEFGVSEIAVLQGIPVEEARSQYRHLELNGPEDGNGIQITLFDDTATITVPYWHSGRAAERVIGEIWGYVSLLEQHGGYRTYDPQLDRILDLRTDRGAVTTRYREVVDTIAGETKRQDSRPWWRFW